MFTARRLVLAAASILGPSLAHSIKFDPLEIGRHELTDSVKTAVCELRLAAAMAPMTNFAYDAFREFRVRTLAQASVEAAYVPRLRASRSDHDPARVAAHVRGIETWTDLSPDHRAAGFVMHGAKEIETYFTLQRGTRREVEHVQETFECDVGRGVAIMLLRSFSLGVLPFPLLVHGPLGLVPLFALTPWAPFEWRLFEDTQRDRTYAAIEGFVDGASDSNDWVFSSRAYRVSRRTIDALWAGDPAQLEASLIEDTYESAWWLNRYVLMPGAEAWRGRPASEAFGARLAGTIIVDQLARVHPRRGQPMLVTTVRTTSRHWAKIPRPRGRAARDGALVPSGAH